MNGVLNSGEFPAIWKTAKVVLLLKPGKPNLVASSYRPLCLLDTFGKFLESLITRRLNQALGEHGLSEFQFGFRPGRSTVDPIRIIYDLADEERRKPLKTRRICIVVALDIKNAFNSAPWVKIIKALQEKNIPGYLIRLVKSYLKDRRIVLDEIEMQMTAGVPQGSLISPLLWNILYDGVLRLAMPDGVHLLAYADDLAMVVLADTVDKVESVAGEALDKICRWMDEVGLQLAPEKTEACLLTGRKKCRNPDISLLGTKVIFTEKIKYLGVILDKGLSFKTHLDYVAEKASKAVNSLARIMPRQGGPSTGKRKLLNNVIESIILYAAPVWSRIMNIKRNQLKVCQVQRYMLLRVCRSYKTTSTEALQVLSGVPPMDLRLKERAQCYGLTKEEKDEIKAKTMQEWQARWSVETNGSWTRRLIPNIEQWVLRKHGNITYHMSQILSGHGCFQEYLRRFHIINSGMCMYCEDIDTAEHTMFLCNRWTAERTRAEQDLGQRINADNMVNLMLASQQNWDIIGNLVNDVMKEKEAEERRRKLRRVVNNQSASQPTFHH
ncbi:hypothetical protein WDU94_005421 [Cyamophila willieti]